MKLEVSIGEALDKLSILEIKKELIKDPVKNKDVCNEINEIFPELEKYVNDYQYRCLKLMNKEIWDLCDDMRDLDLDKDTYIKKCVEIVEKNDARFRIKMKINNKYSSKLREQKSYNPKKCMIQIIGNIETRGLIRYASFLHDIIYVHYTDNSMKDMYKDDDTIKIVDECNNFLEKIIIKTIEDINIVSEKWKIKNIELYNF